MNGRKWMIWTLAAALCCLAACGSNTNAGKTNPATDAPAATQTSSAAPQADPGTPSAAPETPPAMAPSEWPYYPVSVGEEIRLYRKDGTELEVDTTYTADVLLDTAQRLMGYVVTTPAADGAAETRAFYGPDGVKRVEGAYEAIQAIGDRVFALPFAQGDSAGPAEIVWPEGAAQPAGETGTPYAFGDLFLYIAEDEFRFYDAAYQLLGSHKGDLLPSFVYPEDQPPKVFPFCEDGVHWGLIDSTATVVVPPDYLSLSMQSNAPDRFIYQTMDGKYGAMDASGKLLTEPIFTDPIEYYGDVVQINGSSGYSWVTATGDEIAQADWGQTLDKAPILARNTQESGDFVYQVLDRAGKPLSESNFTFGGVEKDMAVVQTETDTEIWRADGTVTRYPGMLVYLNAQDQVQWQGQTQTAYFFQDSAGGRVGYCTPDGNRLIDVEGQNISEAKLAGDTVYIVQKTGGLYGGLRSDGTPLFEGDALEVNVANDLLIVYTQEGVRLCSATGEALSIVPYVPRPEDGDGGGE